MATDFGCPITKDEMEALGISTQGLVNIIFHGAASSRVTYFKWQSVI